MYHRAVIPFYCMLVFLAPSGWLTVKVKKLVFRRNLIRFRSFVAAALFFFFFLTGLLFGQWKGKSEPLLLRRLTLHDPGSGLENTQRLKMGTCKKTYTKKKPADFKNGVASPLKNAQLDCFQFQIFGKIVLILLSSLIIVNCTLKVVRTPWFFKLGW